jgi:predicted SAM-dependent methyltransferase
MPEVTSAPVDRNAFITFGSFNRYSKNSILMLKTWSDILNQVPNSRLLICVPEGVIRDNMFSYFAGRGILSERISAFAKVSHPEFWKMHAEVDIALDPFPFGGGTTSCETLWLGVPLVTCTGIAAGEVLEQSFVQRFASRMGYAFLRSLGLQQLAAQTVAEYVSIAVALAKDKERLAQLRQTLRARMANSPLTDEPRFVNEMEAAYRAIWQAWCVQQSETSHGEAVAITLEAPMKTFLHVGCGPKQNDRIVKGFNAPEWKELRLDIDPTVQPDIIGTMTDMRSVESESVDAIYSSHNIEHLYPHEVPVALAEFMRVLKPTGFVIITCPDLQSVCALVAEDKLTDAAYTSPAGPIAPLDILYGHRPAMAKGNLYMAHRCGFTQKVLVATLQSAGFAKHASMKRPGPGFDLWIAATKSEAPDELVLGLAAAHFPK